MMSRTHGNYFTPTSRTGTQDQKLVQVQKDSDIRDNTRHFTLSPIIFSGVFLQEKKRERDGKGER